MRKSVCKAYICAVALLLALVTLTCSCSEKTVPTEPDCTPYPIPAKLSIGGVLDIPFYFSPEASSVMDTESRRVLFYNDKSFVTSVIEDLIIAVSADGVTAFPISNCSLDHVEASGDVCSVFLSCAVEPATEVALRAQCVLCATLHDTFGIVYVNMFINGVPLMCNGFPIGALSPIPDDVTLEDYIQSHLSAYAFDDTNTAVQTNLVYYTQNSATSLIHATAQKTTLSRESTEREIVDQLIERLKMCSIDTASIADCDFDIDIIENTGAKTIKIRVNVANSESAVDKDLLGKSLAMTLLSNLAGYDSIDYGLVGEYGITINRNLAKNSLGTYFKVYYPYLLSDVLNERSISVKYSSAEDHVYWISQMLSNSNGIGILYPRFDVEDCLSVYVSNNMAVIDCSNEFWQTIISFIAEEWSVIENSSSERLLIYGIVNTLTEIPYIDSVLFLNEGKNIGMLGKIYLGQPLYRNIGLVFDN